MGRVFRWRPGKRLGLGIAFAMATVSNLSLFAGALGVTAVPVLAIAAIAELVAALTVARVFWDYEQEARRLKAQMARPDEGKLRRDFSDYLGLAMLAWRRADKTDKDEMAALTSEIIVAVRRAVGFGEGAAFLQGVYRNRADQALARLVKRVHGLNVAPEFDVEDASDKLSKWLPEL